MAALDQCVICSQDRKGEELVDLLSARIRQLGDFPPANVHRRCIAKINQDVLVALLVEAMKPSKQVS